jgi:hypothetical protein
VMKMRTAKKKTKERVMIERERVVILNE